VKLPHALHEPAAVLQESIAISKVGVVPDELFAVATIVRALTFLVTNSVIALVVLALWPVAFMRTRQFCKESACATLENASSASSRIFFILPVVTLDLKVLLKADRNNNKTQLPCGFCATIYC
jgi:hypothetical protein